MLDVQEYQGEWSNGLDVGFALNMPFVEHSYKCGNCVNTTKEQSGTYEIKSQGRLYVHEPVNSQFEIGVQPDTGFMQYKNKLSTMFMQLTYFADGSQDLQPSAMQAFPLPELIPLIDLKVPIYDLKDTMNANQTLYLGSLGYVSDNATKVRNETISFIVLTCFMFIAGIVCAVMHKKNTSSVENMDSEVRRSEDDSHTGLIDKDTNY